MTRKKPRQPQRRTRSRGHLAVVPTRSDRPEDQPLIQTIRQSLRQEGPLPTLVTVSQLLETAESRGAERDPEFGETMLETMIASFSEYSLRETTAALHVISALVPDDLLRTRLAKVLATRRQPMPDWIGSLSDVQVERVVRSHHVLEDGDDYFLGVRLGSDRFTVLVYVDHNLGQIVKDAFVGDRETDQAVAFAQENSAPDTAYDDENPADARRRIEDAIRAGRSHYPDHATDTWPGIRPLVEHIMRAMPAGGSAYPLTTMNATEVTELVDDFLRSPYGRLHDDLDLEVRLLVAFGLTHGLHDPLQWTPVSVEILLDQWLPMQTADVDVAEVPDVLRDFIRYCHVRTGIAPRWTAETLTSVSRWENSFYAQVLGDSWTRTEELTKGFLRSHGIDERSRLERAVGSAEAVEELDDEPLPAEPFNWTDVADDLQPKLAEIIDLLAEHASAMLDEEHLTAELRLLRGLALAEPALLRSRAAARTSAAVIVWLVAKANETTSVYGPLTMGELLEPLGGTANSERAERFLAALGGTKTWGSGEVYLGSPDYLVSARRAELMEEGDLV